MRQRPEDPLAQQILALPRLARAREPPGAHPRARLGQPASSRSSSTPIGCPARISSRAASTLPKIPQVSTPRGLLSSSTNPSTPLRSGSLPRRDAAQARVRFPDRLVAELEQVGVEERQVVVRLAGAGCVRADRAAVAVRVVLVLDPDALPERLRREANDVARREDVLGARNAPVLVHDDPVVDGEARALGELDVRDDPEPGHDRVGASGSARPERDDRLGAVAPDVGDASSRPRPRRHAAGTPP